MTSPLGLDQFMKQRVKSRNREHLSPTDRADFINSLIHLSLGLDSPKDVATNPLYWDIVCFATEFLNLFALQSEDEEILLLAKAFNERIYSLHYSYPDGMNALGPAREVHESIWLSRLEWLEEMMEGGE